MCASKHILASATWSLRPLSSNQHLSGGASGFASGFASLGLVAKACWTAPATCASRSRASAASRPSPSRSELQRFTTPAPESSRTNLRCLPPRPTTQPAISGGTSNVSATKSSSRTAAATACVDGPLTTTRCGPARGPRRRTGLEAGEVPPLASASSTRTITFQRSMTLWMCSPFFPMSMPAQPSGMSRRCSDSRPMPANGGGSPPA
mmetsp:Transcript_74759/g.228731  ORF Transcript_74759/g.228731 Transcript_74759/m.228731 type:complete len:207 (+) Transcript_74759:129-749(+)